MIFVADFLKFTIDNHGVWAYNISNQREQMNFQEYLAIRGMDNPLDFVTRIIVKSVYPEYYSISPSLNNGVVFVKEKFDSEGEYFDIYGNRGNEVFLDPVTNNSIAVDLKGTVVPVKKHLESKLEYVGDENIEKLKDYLLVCPMLFTTFSDKLIKEHGDELMSEAVSSLKKHFKLFCWRSLDRGYGERFVHNIHGSALASNFTGGVNKIYRKYLEANGFSKDRVDVEMQKLKMGTSHIENYEAKLEKRFASCNQVKIKGGKQ